MHIKTSDQPILHMGYRGYSCNWGLHICGLYETEEERDEIVFGYLNQGDIEGDLQFYCPSERTELDFREKFTRYCGDCGCDCGNHLDDPDHYIFMGTKELYYPDGIFSPDAMDDGLDAFYEKSQKNGKRNIRATAEMVWAMDAIPGTELLMVYESRLNYFIPGKPWVSVCLYNTSKFPGSTIMRALQTHPFTISGGTIMQNPYYIDPDKWLADNAPHYLNC